MKSWQFFGAPGSLVDRYYEWLRTGLNRRLVSFIVSESAGARISRSRSSVEPSADLRKELRRTPSHDEAGPGAHSMIALEAGSGTAGASSQMGGLSSVALAVCLDIDGEALRIARRRDPRLALVQGDLANMPFRDGAFDIVFNNSTIEHLDDPALAVGEMSRVCKRNHHVFVGVPYRLGPLGFQSFISGTRAGVWLGRVFSRSSLSSLLRSAGLKPVAFRTFFFRFFLGGLSVKE